MMVEQALGSQIYRPLADSADRALLQKALPLPAGAAYQGWWMALVAVALGRRWLSPRVIRNS